MLWDEMDMPTMRWLEDLSKEWVHDREWHEGYAWYLVKTELWRARQHRAPTSPDRLAWVTRAAAMLQDATRILDVAIAAAVHEGESLRSVACAADVSHMTVRRTSQRLALDDLVALADPNRIESDILNPYTQLTPLPHEMHDTLLVDHRGWLHPAIHRMVRGAAPPNWLDDRENERRAIELTTAEYSDQDLGFAPVEHADWPPEKEQWTRHELFEFIEARAEQRAES